MAMIFLYQWQVLKNELIISGSPVANVGKVEWTEF